jgi:hypothetical protein
MNATTKSWGLAAADLPERLDRWRVLEIGAAPPEGLLDERGIKDLITVPWPTEEDADRGPFQLAHLTAGLDGELHPLSVGAWLWGRLLAGGTLVLEATVLADPAQTAFAEFVVAPSGSDQRWRWLPGRLALRWMIENSGFDDVVWLGERNGKEPETIEVCLQATRGERGPAVDLTRQPLAPRRGAPEVS